MAYKYHAKRFVEIVIDGESVELEAMIEFTITPYVPAKGPSYASGGQPAEGGHVEDVWCKGIKFPKQAADVKLDLPGWLADTIAEKCDGDSLYREAMEYEDYLEDEAAEYRHQTNIEMRLEALAADFGE